MTRNQPQSILASIYDPLLALPIAVKLSVVLIITLVIGGLIIDAIAGQVISASQQDLILEDLGAISGTQAFRLADTVGQETVVLNQLGTFTEVQGALKLASISPELAPTGVSAAANALNIFRQTHSQFDYVVLIDLEGHVIASDPAVMISDRLDPEVSWPWYAEVIDGGRGKFFVRSLSTDGITQILGVRVSFGIPVYDTSSPGQLLGVIYATWNLNDIGTISTDTGGREVIIAEKDGSVLVSSAVTPGFGLPGDLVARMISAPDGAFTYTASNGIEWLYAFSTTGAVGLAEDNPTAELDWLIITRQPAAAVAETSAFILSRLRLILSATVAAAALMLLLTARVLTIPLGQLTLAARRIAEGNYDTRIPDNLPRDEIGQLALTLNQVVGQLVAQLSRLRAAAQVSRVAASNLEQEQLLTQVLRSITHQFDVPDVRIYQADSKTDRATIIAALGAEGEILLRQKHQVPLDESTLVGRALVLRSPQLGGGVDAPAFAGAKVRNAEIALPLITAGRLIGTLHIIGDRPGEFDADDVDVLSLVADQLSAAINNAQLLEQGQTNIAEIEALNRRLTRQGWEDYIKEAPNLRHTLDPEAEWPEIAVASLEASGEAIRAETYTDHQGRNIIAVPLVLRGESIGTIAATRPSGHQWNREEITVVESVAARMSMIAEGIRLLEESERRTRVEQQVNTVSAELLQRASSVESVLQAALNQLSGTLGSDHISLRIGAPPVQSDHQIDSGDGGRGGQNGRADNAEQSVGAGQQDQGMSDA